MMHQLYLEMIPFSQKFKMSRLMTKPTKWSVCPVKTQISLGIRPVWSESSLSAWRNIGSSVIHWAHCEDRSDWADAHAILLVCREAALMQVPFDNIWAWAWQNLQSHEHTVKISSYIRQVWPESSLFVWSFSSLAWLSMEWRANFDQDWWWRFELKVPLTTRSLLKFQNSGVVDDRSDRT